MSTRESRRQEYSSSSNVVRTLSPSSRPLSPYQTKPQFDNNLDYMLDDLQKSISRPGSSLGQPINNGSYSTHREVQYTTGPANSTTVLRERSLSPNQTNFQANKIYKTANYEYSTSTLNGRNSNQGYNHENGHFSEINKLDSLLSDLEHERGATLDRHKNSTRSSNHSIGIDSGLIEPGHKVIKTTTTYSKNPTQRELVFDSPDSTARGSFRHRSPGSYETKVVETVTTKRNVGYDDSPYGGVTKTSTRTLSPVGGKNEKYYTTETTSSLNDLESQTIPRNVNYNEVVRVENSVGPDALENVHLSGEILPKPKTKVTTTVRTYTYEIPEPLGSSSNTVTYNTVNTINNQSNQTTSYSPERDPPKNTAMFYKTERHENKVNYYPNQQPTHDYPSQEYPLTIQEVPPTQNTHTIYKYDVTNTTNHHHQPPAQVPPGGINIYQPPQPVTNYVYKTETNTTNKQYRSPTPTNFYPVQPAPHHGNPGYPHGHPHEPSTIVYKTTTTTNTRNVNHGPNVPREREPLLQPFPVDGPVITEVDGNPPKHLHDLMATFGDTSEIPYTQKRVQIAEKPLTPTRINDAQHTLTPLNQDKHDGNSRNVSGPPVYYPPNHEMFTTKQKENEAAWRAQGGYAHASGKYSYEKESKSKSSSKSGGAVVPVCLPLCCAMPCTIM